LLKTNVKIKNEESMQSFAKILANYITSGEVIYLVGDLGAGKTTFTRYLLQHMGHVGRVKSPTFSIVEEYEVFGKLNVAHFDLYRVSDSDELYHIGIGDYLTGSSVLIIEWPSNGFEILPNPTIIIDITIVSNNSRVITLSSNNSDLIKKADDSSAFI
jgi:tRNA threonylcarbamoyladenosine biosynthesis protein TsaE